MPEHYSRRHILKRAGQAAAVLPVAGLGGCKLFEAENAPLTLSGHTMGTTYHLALADPAGPEDRPLIHAVVEDAFTAVDQAMSTYRESSELSRFNARQSTGWMPISANTVTVLGEALRIARVSDGAFDPSVGPLVTQWGFGPLRTAPAEIEHDARPRPGAVDFRHIHLRDDMSAVRKDHAHCRLDLSGIAKGYALDIAAENLRGAGFGNFMLEVGGEILTAGRKANGDAWRIGIEKPVPGATTLHRVVALDDAAIATSGDYRIFKERNGVRYSHLIDPRTGRPVDHALASVSVIERSTMGADAWSTALMVLGPEAGPRLSEKEGIAALFIVRTEAGLREIASSAFKRRTAPGAHT